MLTLKQLTPKINGIRKSTKAMRASVQEVLIHAAGNAFQDGDVTSFDKLIDATRGADQKAIMKWVREFGFAVYNTDKSCYNVNKAMRKSADFVDGEAVVEYLETQPTWYELQASTKDIAKELDVKSSLLCRVQRGLITPRIAFMTKYRLFYFVTWIVIKPNPIKTVA